MPSIIGQSAGIQKSWDGKQKMNIATDLPDGSAMSHIDQKMEWALLLKR